MAARGVRALAVVVAAIVLASCGGGGNDGAGWPSVTIESLDGAEVASDSLVADVPTVVTVWAVWCTPCRDELPALQALMEGHGGAVEVVGVNNGDDPGAASAFLDSLGVSYTSYRDPQGRLTSALGVVSLPATIIVLPDGEIAWQHLGAVSMDEVERRLAPHLDA